MPVTYIGLDEARDYCKAVGKRLAALSAPSMLIPSCRILCRIIPVLVLGFWDNNTGMCGGAKPIRRDVPDTTGI